MILLPSVLTCLTSLGLWIIYFPFTSLICTVLFNWSIWGISAFLPQFSAFGHFFLQCRVFSSCVSYLCISYPSSSSINISSTKPLLKIILWSSESFKHYIKIILLVFLYNSNLYLCNRLRFVERKVHEFLLYRRKKLIT